MVTESARGSFTRSKTLTDLLPPPPAHLLLLGQETGAVADGLLEQGYTVTAAPLFEPHSFAQLPSATRLGIYQVDLSLPQASSDVFDAVVVLGVSPQIHPLALFDQLAQCTAHEGLVLLVGLDPQGPPARVTRWLEYVVTIGTRCGFIQLELEADADPIDRGTFVRALRKKEAPRWRLGHLRQSDYPETAVLFQEVFGHPLSPELWAWKYANGGGNAVLARRDGVLVAHYGGMYRDVMLCGKPDWVFQICDVMVHPKERGVMTRRGPFLLTAATSAEIYGPLGFGFPNDRHVLLAEKVGLYAEVGQMREVRWEPASPRFRLGTRLRVVARDSAASRVLVESLWAAMAQDLRHDVVGVRDWAFLEHRYFKHPHHQYEVLSVTSRLTGKSLGLIVLRRWETSCELVDVIAPLANLPVLVDQARRLTGLWGLSSLYCWITKNHLPHFLVAEGKELPLNVTIPTSCWTNDPRADVFKDRWWLMSGDTDFR
ncbi:MAG: GNAT family N-acetyltransferase [Pseudomonadota bacterium]